MLKFISAFVPNVDAKPLVYDGTANLKKRAMDPDAAYEWHRKTQKYVGWASCELFLFGEKRVKKVPVLLPEYEKAAETEDAMKEANEIIRTLSRGGLVSDEFFQLLSRVFDEYSIVKVKVDDNEFYAFKRVKN